jgi:serine/threonine protein kinase
VSLAKMGIPRIGRLDLFTCPLLGQGGMAKVRKVKIKDREVAVKIPNRPHSRVYIESLYREARVLIALSGVPNIVSFQGFILLRQASFNSDHTPCSTFEVIDGPNLESKCLKSESPLPPIEALNITNDIALALACMHQKGVAHRDVKPANILFTGSRAILIDFDLTKEIGIPIAAAGTVGYISPESYNFVSPSERTDIFALGITLFEISAGIYALEVKPPGFFSSGSKQNFSEIEVRVKGSNLPIPMKDLILRMAAIYPHDRPSSCEEVMEEIAKTKEKL